MKHTSGGLRGANYLDMSLTILRFVSDAIVVAHDDLVQLHADPFSVNGCWSGIRDVH